MIKQIDEDCIYLQLTTQLNNKNLKLTNKDLVDGRLKKDSLIVVPKNFTLHKSIMIKKLGTVSKEKMNIVYEVFCSEIGCNNKNL